MLSPAGSDATGKVTAAPFTVHVGVPRLPAGVSPVAFGVALAAQLTFNAGFVVPLFLHVTTTGTFVSPGAITLGAVTPVVSIVVVSFTVTVAVALSHAAGVVAGFAQI